MNSRFQLDSKQVGSLVSHVTKGFTGIDENDSDYFFLVEVEYKGKQSNDILRGIVCNPSLIQILITARWSQAMH
jgi:hypothetical protein